jgi:predicted MFS family arabinose efflux permease
MLSASLPVLAFDRYGDAKVVGWLFAAFGLGGLIGTLAAFQLVKRVEPLVMASLAAVGFALPLWVLAVHVPLAAILVAIAR